MPKRTNITRKSNRGASSTLSSRVSNSLTSRFSNLNFKERRQNITRKTTIFVRRRPMASFFIALGVLLLAIILNTVLTPKPKENTQVTQTKTVSVYEIGQAPKATFSAKIDKKGVIQIVAQTPGIVSGINVVEGQEVVKGTNLVSLASNYQGGNALSVSRQMAAVQYNNTKDTYDTQKGIIDNQRSLADLNKTNSDKLRDITDQSANDTQTVIDLNASIITTLEANLQTLQASGAPQAQTLPIQQQIAQYRSGQAQLQSAQRQARYSADTANPPVQMAQITHDLTVKQLDVQQKALEMGLEISRLQLQMAQITEATMYPAAPFDAVVEKVHVSIGQAVNPGAALVTLSANTKNATATVVLPFDTAQKVSRVENSTFYIKNKQVKLTPEFVSADVTDGQLNSVLYTIPEELYESVSDGQYIKVEIPIGAQDSISSIPYLPIDIVFQTQDGAYVYVEDNGKVKAKKVELGDVVGSNVAVLSGLGQKESVILDRNVIEGEKVKVENN